MGSFLAKLVLMLLSHGPEMFHDVQGAVAEIESSKNGLDKLKGIAETLGHFATHVATALPPGDQSPPRLMGNDTPETAQQVAPRAADPNADSTPVRR